MPKLRIRGGVLEAAYHSGPKTHCAQEGVVVLVRLELEFATHLLKFLPRGRQKQCLPHLLRSSGTQW